MSHTVQTLLTIAGSDSSAGAGVQADIKTAAALGVYASSVITNITAQNTAQVRSVFPLPADVIRQQFEAVVDDFNIDVIKIGLLGSLEVVEQVVSCLSSMGENKPPVVLDPVLGASSGTSFMDEEAVAVLKSKLCPLCDVITPNISEAERLLSLSICSREDMEQAARLCVERGLGRSVVITGGEGFEQTCVDMLFTQNDLHWFEKDRVGSSNSHGTGCTFSTALACHLAKGSGLVEAVSGAKTFVFDCLRDNLDLKLGRGNGPLLHKLIK